MLSLRRTCETPAAWCRRRPFLAAVVAPALLTVACAGEPVDPARWDGVRATLVRATGELRRADPAAAAEVERLIGAAEAASAREQAVARWRRDPDRVAAAWSEATRAAQRGLARTRAARSEKAARLASLLGRAEPRITAAEKRLGQAGVNGRHAGDTATARYHVRTARKLAADGRYDAAVTHAEEALALAAELDHSWSRSIERFSDPALLALWREQAEATITASRRSGDAAIIVDKLHRRLHLYEGGRERAVFAAELGGNGLERKLYSGDRATPEGRYRVTVKKSGAATVYYLALLIDYPNEVDLRRHRAAAAAGEVPRGRGAGGLIEIHGHGGSGRDWTDGCVALRDEDMERLFQRVRVGTPVTIVGTL